MMSIHPIIRLLIACMVGLLLWFFLRTYYNHSLSVMVPLSNTAPSASHAVLQEAARVTLTGPWKTLCHIIHEQPVIKLNTELYSRGLHEVKVTTQHLALPPTVQLTSPAMILLFVNPST